MKNTTESNFEIIPLKFYLKTNRGRLRKWTFEEFVKAKKGFKEGAPIKVLAQDLGRSETAVNKFLSRSGIRKAMGRDKQSKHRLKPHVKKVAINSVKTTHLKSTRVSFADVVSYLMEKGYTVRRNQVFGNTYYKTEKYLLNERPASKLKLLLYANKLRTEENKEIFKNVDFS